MRSVAMIVLLFVSFMTFFVSGCGDNPEKKKVLLSQKEAILPQMSSEAYSSGDGKSITILDKKTGALSLKFDYPSEEVFISYHPDSNRVILRRDKVWDGYSNGLIELASGDSGDDFAPLKEAHKLYTKEKLAALENGEEPPANPFSEAQLVNLQCFEQRDGMVAALHKRPKDVSDNYDSYEIISQFKESPSAAYVVRIEYSGNQSEAQYSIGMGNSHMLKTYIKNELVGKILKKRCARLQRNNDGFESFFPSRTGGWYGSGVSTATIPLEVLNSKIFQIARRGDDELSIFQDNYLFSSEKHEVNYESHAEKLLKSGKLYSGKYIDNGADTVVRNDEEDMSIDIDWKESKLNFYKKKSSNQSCDFKIRGDIQSVIYNNRRSRKFDNSMVVTLKLAHIQAKDCSGTLKISKNLKKDDFLKIHIQPSYYQGIDNRKIQLTLLILDPQTDMTLLSSKDFVRR